MANTNSISKATPSAILAKNPVPCHQQNNWLTPSVDKNRDAQFAATVVDVARGAGVIASILSSHLIDLAAIDDDAGSSVRTLLSKSDTSALAHLAVFSLDQLYALAEGQVDRFNANSDKGAAK